MKEFYTVFLLYFGGNAQGIETHQLFLTRESAHKWGSLMADKHRAIIADYRVIPLVTIEEGDEENHLEFSSIVKKG